MSESNKAPRFAFILLITLCITYIVENFLRSTAGALTPILINELGDQPWSHGVTNHCFLPIARVPKVLPPELSGIGMGTINAVCTLGISVLSPVYGGLVDITGGYMASNLLMLLGALLVPVLMLRVKDLYGGLEK